jgi:hypothetical protein
VLQAEIIALCPSIVAELLKHDYKQQLEMKGMFRSAVDTLFTGALYNTGIIEQINSAHDLILFLGGMAWHRDLRVLVQTGPSDHLSLSVGYAFPSTEITDQTATRRGGGRLEGTLRALEGPRGAAELGGLAARCPSLAGCCEDRHQSAARRPRII